MQHSLSKVHANVHPAERIISAFTGAFFLADGFNRRSGFRTTELLAASYLLLRGIYGYCVIYQLMGKKPFPDMVRNINFSARQNLDIPRMEAYKFWRKFENFPTILNHVKHVSIVDETTSKWTIKGPVNIGTLSWKANILKDEPGYFISWASIPGSVLETSGKVRFLSNGRNGTILHVNISYRPNVGILGAAAVKTLSPLLRNMLRKDLKDLKLIPVRV